MPTRNGIKTKQKKLFQQIAAYGMTCSTNLNNQSNTSVFLSASRVIKSLTRIGTLARFCASCKMEGKKVVHISASVQSWLWSNTNTSLFDVLQLLGVDARLGWCSEPMTSPHNCHWHWSLFLFLVIFPLEFFPHPLYSNSTGSGFSGVGPPFSHSMKCMEQMAWLWVALHSICTLLPNSFFTLVLFWQMGTLPSLWQHLHLSFLFSFSSSICSQPQNT